MAKQQYRKLEDCFKEVETATASHILFEQFDEYRPGTNKFIFYLGMDGIFGHTKAKAPDGNMGYKLEFIPEPV